MGGIYVAQKTDIGNFISPVLLFQDGHFVAVSTARYLTYLLIALALITSFLLYATVLLNLLIKNVYATVLILIVVFFLPDLLVLTGVEVTWIHPIKYIDIASVLTGDLAGEFGNNKLDYNDAFVWLLVQNLIVVAILYGRNKLVHIRKANTSIKSI